MEIKLNNIELHAKDINNLKFNQKLYLLYFSRLCK
jgi:hypothetical protein